MNSVTIKTHKAKAAEAATKISHNPLLALAGSVSCMACKPPGFGVATNEA